ncbi:winged helix-turn-helix transcriptional regulator [Kribbella sp. VKM Ac-2566]|uniref:winged helix-turn-helix transcriptional regulator n=1 Tax=Kribbella sp. VKM Ac-2566 TaxID=2512218 RepID=UPI002102890A|nr:winged helix-turn-helix transcriptional regulator [Kribbella sp. VKM Ac-2566]
MRLRTRRRHRAARRRTCTRCQLAGVAPSGRGAASTNPHEFIPRTNGVRASTNLGGITRKMLTQTLWALERSGLVNRTIFLWIASRGVTELAVESA